MGSLPICLARWVSAIERYYFNTVCKKRASIDLKNLMQSFLKDIAKIEWKVINPIYGSI